MRRACSNNPQELGAGWTVYRHLGDKAQVVWQTNRSGLNGMDWALIAQRILASAHPDWCLFTQRSLASNTIAPERNENNEVPMVS